MPIPAPNLYPEFNIVRLSHVELALTDLARSRAFWVDTLGLQVTDETAARSGCGRWRSAVTTASC